MEPGPRRCAAVQAGPRPGHLGHPVDALRPPLGELGAADRDPSVIFVVVVVVVLGVEDLERGASLVSTL